MKTFHPLMLAACLQLAALSATHAADVPGMLQLATCEESWLEFKDDPAKAERFYRPLLSQFRTMERDGSMVPVGPLRLLGHPVSRVYPESVGMGLGFSVIVEAGFDAARSSMEKQMGKSFEHCGVEEGAKSCEHRIAEKKTVVLMEGRRGNNPLTLVGCYYYYEK